MDDMITSHKKLSTNFRNLVNSFARDLLPHHCYLCKSTFKGAGNFCQPCYKDLPWQKLACSRCAQTIYANPLSSPLGSKTFSTRKDCFNCEDEHFFFERCICPFDYLFPIPEIIHQFKYRSQLFWSLPLALILISYFRKHRDTLYFSQYFPYPDFIVPVPMSRQKRKSRSYNHSIELAYLVSKGLKIPLLLNQVNRIDSHKNQATLSLRARRNSIKNAFSIDSNNTVFEGKSVMIIDDVITSSSTANALSNTLKKSGAKSVEVWSVARTQKKSAEDELNG